ncbi:Holliday junction resolvase RuvX [Fodinibius halophilus]|uniref:Putative pre-16S rRNA nuclease n=1 Tax=Fodinibius halophilus TaxID=1736908 RepID=A0A6M1TLX7_9BACT|nr:Holliday junction resolvase RuvX [Fodinibius halophilus]
MAKYGRIIGLDIGTKWIGVARTDLLKTVANPIGTYHTENAIDEIKKLVDGERVEKIVVGWPLTPAGQEGKAIKMVEEFVARLTKALPDMEIDKIDERYTTKEAVRAMVEAGVPKMKQRDSDRVNQAAAAIILQKYIESRKTDNVRITDRYV